MPWKVGRKTAKGWEILRADTGQVVGYSKTRELAAASVRARYANSPEFNRRLRKKSWRSLFGVFIVAFAASAGLCKNKVTRYEDLGSDSIDVSAYPEDQKAYYSLFLNRCSRCHSPAWTINSPHVTEKEWKRYVSILHVRSNKIWVKPDEPAAILSFLVYDSQIRKVEHQSDFMKLQDVLKEQFAALKRQ
jgi:hypothetical protein